MFINLFDFILNLTYTYCDKFTLNRAYSLIHNFSYFCSYFKFFFINLIDFCFFKIIGVFYLFESSYIYFNKSLIYGLKFSLSILFLIFIRAGIPRYRYDFLTIIG